MSKTKRQFAKHPFCNRAAASIFLANLPGAKKQYQQRN
jgi:hypothetical protein